MWNMVGSGYIAHFRELNNRLILRGRNVLVVGGTGGIGAAAAIKFAQLGASVTVAGRNQKNGMDVVAKMTDASPNKESAEFHYLPVDITLMADVRRFTNEYMKLNNRGLNALVVTSGGLNYGPVRNTSEGNEHNFAISYLGRFLVIARLLPLLVKASEGGRALTVLSAGRAGPIDLDDIQMQKPGAYTKSKSLAVNCMATDFMVEELTERTKGNNTAFYHLDPGAVATDLLTNNNIPLASIATPLMKWFITAPEDYAEVVVHIATAPEFGPERSGIGLGPKAQPVKAHKFQSTPGAREKVWKYSEEVSGLNLE